MAGKRDRGKAARRRAQMDRLAAASPSTSGETRKAQHRDEAARAAAAGPSAARWVLATDTGPAAVDIVADLLALDPRTRLRGRGDTELRTLAGHVDALVQMGVASPSGRDLLEVLVTDPAARSELAPSFDLDALLTDAPVSDRTHDRTVRLATAMLSRAAEHRDGQIDLHALVAPVGAARHPDADGVESVVHVACDGLDLPACSAPAIVVTEAGWIGASPVEAFLAAARGLLVGSSADTLGEALYAWLQHADADPSDEWWTALSGRIPVDVPDLLQQSAARAGSDHPAVAGSVLVELIGLRHPS